MKREKSFKVIVKQIKKIYQIDNLNKYLILAGAIVPYLVLNENSNRLHGDIDFICKINDISYIRNIFKNYGYYDKNLDSLEKIGKDYGFEMLIDNIKVGIYPFEEEGGYISQYSYDSKSEECKKKILNLNYAEYVSGNNEFKFMSLEVILKSKIYAARQKDIYDVNIILSHEFNHELYKKIEIKRCLTIRSQVIFNKK